MQEEGADERLLLASLLSLILTFPYVDANELVSDDSSSLGMKLDFVSTI